MFTAIVLSPESREFLLQAARDLDLLPSYWKAKAHHVTLALGDRSGAYVIGSERELIVTGYGITHGRVSAFRVAGAEDSTNTVAHVTIGHAPEAKPRESNDIETWHDCAPLFIVGTIEICH